MVTLIPVIGFILYFAVLIYLISLFSRLVRAVETIASKIEGPSKI
jgi:hypothetical protein